MTQADIDVTTLSDWIREYARVIGENAEHDWNIPGLRRASVSAPCPPIEWPKIDFLSVTGRLDSISD